MPFSPLNKILLAQPRYLYRLLCTCREYLLLKGGIFKVIRQNVCSVPTAIRSHNDVAELEQKIKELRMTLILLPSAAEAKWG